MIQFRFKPFASIVRAGLAALALFGPAAAIVSTCARAGDAVGAWTEGFNNKARLIAGTVPAAGGQTAPAAGVEIVMSDGFKTYWRNPGEAGGVPPEFDWTGSENLDSARVLYPVPHRTKDKAGENIAYKDRVTFPVVIVPKDKGAPVTLKLKVIYGVCKDICIPAEAELALDIPLAVGVNEALSAAIDAVPVSTEGGGQSLRAFDPARDPKLEAWQVHGTSAAPELRLTVKDPAGTEGDAFLSSDDGLYMPMTKRVKDENGAIVYHASLSEGATAAELKGKAIRVTLAGTKGQSETIIQLP